MATNTPFPNIWRYQINLSRAGQKALIGIQLRNVGTPANSDYFNFCNSILVGQEGVSGFRTVTKGLLVNEWQIDSHQLQAIDPIRYVPLVRTGVGYPSPGSRVGVPMPINTQVAVARKSPVARRYGQSILKPPFGGSLDTTDKASWTPAFITEMDAWAAQSMANFIGASPGDVLQPVVWSSGPVANALEFKTATVNPYLRVMRRRTVGLGK